MERVHGCLRIGFVYFATGVFSSAAAAISAPSTAIVGASSAIFGLSGVAVGDIFTNRALHESPFATVCRVCLVAVIQFRICFTGSLQTAIGAAPGLNYAAYVFGFLTGFVMSFSFRVTTHGSSRTCWSPFRPYRRTTPAESRVVLRDICCSFTSLRNTVGN